MQNSKRNFLATTALGALAPLAATSASAQTAKDKAPRTFVLVHGAWHGAWCWARVADRLRQQGHKVYAITLTGLADRSHLMSDAITLDTHITDIVNLFKWEDIDQAVLVAHSYGGWPVSGALEQIHDKVASVIYLDSFVPENGQSGADLVSPGLRKLLDDAMAQGQVSRNPPKAEVFVFDRPEDAAWVTSKMTAQPNRVALQKIRLTGGREKVARKAYIRTTRYKNERFDGYVKNLGQTPGWRVHELDAGHDAMVDKPEEVTRLFLEFA
ncbi:alpha/beta fold hydrolase [Ottowia thiooxydans]|uniref:alpha/beta fold hydrolase n=1 Tax=Ottowia thiooxydans TaxID=219182 RepID=UPI000423BEF3|nr:alpha/beta fold hydrolase [Ottowia thiooxydans]